MRGTNQLEQLSESMFAPLSPREASLVIGGQVAAGPIGYTGYDTLGFLPDGTVIYDFLVTDEIWIVVVPIGDVARPE